MGMVIINGHEVPVISVKTIFTTTKPNIMTIRKLRNFQVCSDKNSPGTFEMPFTKIMCKGDAYCSLDR